MFLTGIIGLFIGIVGFREYTNLTRSDEKVSVLQIIKIAVEHGIASGLIFFAIISSGSLFDPEYVWSLQNFGSALFVCLILGVIVTIGVVYQVYTTVVFRDMLIRKDRKKNKSENHNSF